MNINNESLSSTRPNGSVPAEVAGQVASACALLSHHLGDSLQAIHLFGSAVDGGLKPQSDIDLLVTVSKALTEQLRHDLMMDLQAISAWPVVNAIRPLEVTVVQHAAVVPWRYPPRRECQYGEWLRDELSSGQIQGACVDHDLAILITKAQAHSICLLGIPAGELFEPVPRRDLLNAFKDTIDQWQAPADWEADERNVVLALARIWFSLATGGFAPKDSAAQWALQRLPAQHQPVLQSAMASYLGQAADDLANDNLRIAAYVHFVKATIYALDLFAPEKRANPAL